MKVTLDRINAVRGIVPATVDECRTVVEAVLRDVPDVVPYAFPGYPENEVYLHKCGTVVDVLPGANETRDSIEGGYCDCESTSPWMRIYVEKQA